MYKGRNTETAYASIPFIIYRVLVAPEGVCSSRCDSERVAVAVNSAARKSRDAHGLALKKRWYRVYV